MSDVPVDARDAAYEAAWAAYNQRRGGVADVVAACDAFLVALLGHPDTRDALVEAVTSAAFDGRTVDRPERAIDGVLAVLSGLSNTNASSATMEGT